jgi:hypothetical protein
VTTLDVNSTVIAAAIVQLIETEKPCLPRLAGVTEILDHESWALWDNGDANPGINGMSEGDVAMMMHGWAHPR